MNRRFGSGRDLLIGRSIEHSAPPTLRALEYDGAVVLGGDGNLWWAIGGTWRKTVDEALVAAIADDVLADVFRTQLADVQLIVDATATEVEGAVYNSINDALEYASLLAGTYRSTWAATTPVRVNIHLAAGFVWREQIRNVGLDLSRVTITAEDMTVTCESAFLTKAGGGTNEYHAAIAVFGGAGPNVQGFVLVDDGTEPPQDAERVAAFGAYTPRTQGVRVTSGGFFNCVFRGFDYDLTPITPRPGGVRGFHRAVECGGGSSVSVEASWLDQCREFAVLCFGGRVTLFGVDAGNCTGAQTLRASGGVIEVATIHQGPDAIVTGLYGGNFRRNGVAGSDTAGDMSVTNGGQILVRSALALGGTTQVPNAWTANGIIFDARDVSPPVLAGLIAPQSYTVGTLPAASPAGRIVYVTNGAVGAPILAFSDGTNWLRSDTRTAVTAS